MSDTDLEIRRRLPAPIYDLALRLGADAALNRSTVMLKQTGRMKRKLGTTSWMSFTATQTISTQACAGGDGDFWKGGTRSAPGRIGMGKTEDSVRWRVAHIRMLTR